MGLGHDQRSEQSFRTFAPIVARAAWVGVICFLINFVWRAVLMLAAGRSSPISERRFSDLPKLSSNLGIPSELALIVFSPIIETIGMLGLFGVVEVFSPRTAPPESRTNIFAFSCFGVSWLLHGANLPAVSQGASFFLLAFLAIRLIPTSGVATAFALVAFAHAVWNSIAVTLFHISGALAAL